MYSKKQRFFEERLEGLENRPRLGEMEEIELLLLIHEVQLVDTRYCWDSRDDFLLVHPARTGSINGEIHIVGINHFDHGVFRCFHALLGLLKGYLLTFRVLTKCERTTNPTERFSLCMITSWA